MKFNRPALRSAAEAAIAAHKARHDERVAAWDAAVEADRAEWAAEHGPAWTAACKAITKRVARGQVVRREDVPGVVDSGSTYYSGPHRGRSRRFNDLSEPGTYREPAELRILIGVLDVCADEQVTTAGLRDLGVSGSTMGVVARYLGKAAATH